MIRYRLGCAARHEFESWFRSSADFETLATNELIACPECGSRAVEKLPMAPAVITSPASRAPAPSPPDPSTPEGRAAIARQLDAFRAELTANAEDVGGNFAQEVRLIHYGDAEDRSIYGSSTAEEARELAEEGIPFGILPRLRDDRH